MKGIRIGRRQGGFTILELMVATTVFSVILLLCTSGMIQVGKMFYKGTINSTTQEATRSVLDEVSRAIQFSGGPVNYNSAAGRLCVNGQRYSFVIGIQLAGAQKDVFAMDNPGAACSSSTPNLANGSGFVGLPRELLGEHMRLAAFTVTNNYGGDASLYQITIHILYGDDDLLESSGGVYTGCKSGIGSQYCASSKLSTIVQKRLQ